MPTLLIAEGKHDEQIFIAETGEQLHAHALTLLKERLDQGYWYTDFEGDPAESPLNRMWEQEAQAIADAEDGKKALDFLLQRDYLDFEYEAVKVRVSR